MEIKDVLVSELSNRLFTLKEFCNFLVGLCQVIGLTGAFSNTLIFWFNYFDNLPKGIAICIYVMGLEI